jgi:hypothetical protein
LLLRDTFDHWRSMHRENQLAPIVRPSSYSTNDQADRQEEEVALRREDAVIFTAWDTWKARSKVCLRYIPEPVADGQKLQAVSMDHKRIKRFACSRWIRASELALQAKQAKATADRHLMGTSAVSDMRNGADQIRRRVCDLEGRCQAEIISSYYASRSSFLVLAGRLLTSSGVSEKGSVRYLRRLMLRVSRHLFGGPRHLEEIVIMSPLDQLPHAQVYIPQTLRRHLSLLLRNLPTAD